MRTLLLCSYRALDEGEIALGLTRDDNGKTLLDSQIEALLALGMEVTCVLAGANADEQLRQCRRLAEVDMVFDTATPLSLLSNAREGALSAPHEACFILPVEVPVPPREVWDFLRNEYSKVGFKAEESVLQALVPAQGAPWHFGFPLLFTHQGCQCLQNTEDLAGLVDTRLKYLHLAPEPKPL
ncbi:MAG: hypothetical protein ACXVA9_08195 [Bdellovibrionales bacterium]